MTNTAHVPAEVADAFGVPRDGCPLPGGQGRSSRHGSAVLKWVDDRAEAAWTADVLSTLEPAGFRVPRPLRADDGRWVVEGWSASEFVLGRPRPEGRWDELLTAGRAFHAAVATVPKPAFLAQRRHRWAHADRVAWDGAAVDALPAVADPLARLMRLVRPVHARSQVIHGDLCGNVLLADGLAPAIIDFSPYWRPVGYADAMVAIDAMLWFDGGPDVEQLTADDPDFAQLLVRALIFRLVALNERARDVDTGAFDELPQFAAVAEEVDRVSRGRP